MAAPEEISFLTKNSLDVGHGGSPRAIPNAERGRFFKKAFLTSTIIVMLYFSSTILLRSMIMLAGAGAAIPSTHESGHVSPGSAKKVPQYFDPDPELWPGPTATGRVPFLAQESVVPSHPGQDGDIKRLWGHLSPYAPNSIGFGVEELPLPRGAKVTQLHMLQRHGSRYPTAGTNVQEFGDLIADLRGKFKAKGALSFLNDWTYGLGLELMVPKGRLELYESGVNHYYQYGHLYDPSTKLMARSTTQTRMRQSAWEFLAGFFGPNWATKVDVGYGIEGDSQPWNNSLAGYDNCHNANSFRNRGGVNASTEWRAIYMQEATTRLNELIEGVNLTSKDVYAMQTMCPYETAAFGYSPFCALFTAAEWTSFAYAIDIYFTGTAGFASPTGRAVGLGWAQELAARLEHHTLSYSTSQINTTLDSQVATFPLDQTLYFDFSHDTNILSVLTALGFTQFAGFLPQTHDIGPHNLTVSQVTPFAARLDVEVVTAQHPLRVDRTYDVEGHETKYLRFKLNERTLPHPECGFERTDGLCELDVFLKVLGKAGERARFDEACFGEYETVPYGEIKDGRPVD